MREPAGYKLLEVSVLRPRIQRYGGNHQKIEFCQFGGSTNGQMTHRQIRAHCAPDDAASSLLRGTMTELGLSARAHDKILRVVRTIADLDASEGIQTQHLNEAIHYRMLDRQLWT